MTLEEIPNDNIWPFRTFLGFDREPPQHNVFQLIRMLQRRIGQTQFSSESSESLRDFHWSLARNPQDCLVILNVTVNEL